MQTTLFFARSVLALFLLAITGFGGINDVVYYEIPLTPAEMTADRLSRLRNIILPTELAAADLQVWTAPRNGSMRRHPSAAAQALASLARHHGVRFSAV